MKFNSGIGISSHGSFIEPNIYANRSALILYWLLDEGVKRDFFSIREVRREINVSLGLIQKVFETLVMRGHLKYEGVRTKKQFTISAPSEILRDWLSGYNITKKCKMWTYQTGLSNKEQVINTLLEVGLQKDVVFALHSAAELRGYKNTNLSTVELYLKDKGIKSTLERTLFLEPQERGYSVLLMQPYYKDLIKTTSQSNGKLLFTSSILTFLDLYHFPLRGLEQAEFMAERIPEIKNKPGLLAKN